MTLLPLESPVCPMVFKSPRRLNNHLHVSHLRELEEA